MKNDNDSIVIYMLVWTDYEELNVFIWFWFQLLEM